jgi:beta-xylosidase
MTTDRPRTSGRTVKRRSLLAVGAFVLVGIVVVAALTVFTNDPVGQAGSVPAGHHQVGSGPTTGSVAPPTTATSPTTTTSSTTSAARSTSLLLPPVNTDTSAPALVLPQSQEQADPFILDTGNRYYLYTSNDNNAGTISANVPVVSGTTVGNWGPVTDALPVLPSWVVSGFTWAPDIHRFGANYVLYYTAAVVGTSPSMQCIGDASGTSPTGPFVAQPTPFICQTGNGGSIDPRVFTDADGSNWMVWKSDENIGGSPTPTGIWTSRLSPDGLTLVGSPTRILAPDEPWQGTIVEAPDMVLVGGNYWLFYSANWFDQPAYGIGAAKCAGPQGPCQDLGNQPLVSTNQQGEGPGEESVFVGRNGIWLLYNPWRSYAPSQLTPPRPVAIARIGFGPFGPYLGQMTGSVASGLSL